MCFKKTSVLYPILASKNRGRAFMEGTFGVYHNYYCSLGRCVLAERDNSSECYRLMKNSLKPCNFLCFSFVFANSFGNLFRFLK